MKNSIDVYLSYLSFRKRKIFFVLIIFCYSTVSLYAVPPTDHLGEKGDPLKPRRHSNSEENKLNSIQSDSGLRFVRKDHDSIKHMDDLFPILNVCHDQKKLEQWQNIVSLVEKNPTAYLIQTVSGKDSGVVRDAGIRKIYQITLPECRNSDSKWTFRFSQDYVPFQKGERGVVGKPQTPEIAGFEVFIAHEGKEKLFNCPGMGVDLLYCKGFAVAQTGKILPEVPVVLAWDKNRESLKSLRHKETHGKENNGVDVPSTFIGQFGSVFNGNGCMECHPRVSQDYSTVGSVNFWKIDPLGSAKNQNENVIVRARIQQFPFDDSKKLIEGTVAISEIIPKKKYCFYATEFENLFADDTKPRIRSLDLGAFRNIEELFIDHLKADKNFMSFLGEEVNMPCHLWVTIEKHPHSKLFHAMQFNIYYDPEDNKKPIQVSIPPCDGSSGKENNKGSSY